MLAVLTFLAVNAASAALLFPLAWLVSRWTQRPRLAHALWLIVLVRLMTPPLASLELPVLSGDSVSLPSTTEDIQYEQPAKAPFDGSQTTEPLEPVRRSFRVDWVVALFVVWLLGAVSRLIYCLVRIRQFDRFARQCDAAPADLQASAERCGRLIGLRTCPQVRLVEGCIPPLVWAYGQPIVLLPKDLLARLEPEQIEGILTHELAHLVRRDHWTRRFEFFVQALHWWNPIAWAVCDQVREAEEACCDALVARTFPASRKEYGRALLESLTFLSDGVHVPRLASGLTGANSIKRRLVMILSGTVKDRLGWRGRVSVAVMSLCLLVGSVALTAPPPAEQPQAADDQTTAAGANEDADAAHYQSLATSFASGSLIRDPRRLADKHGLNSVMFEGPKITDGDLQSLAESPELVELGLIATGVKGPGLQQLEGLDRLETLVLAGPNVSDAWLEQLPDLEGLRTLRLWGAGMTSKGLASLSRFRNLETLSLQGVRIGGGGLEVLRQLPKLKSLSLKHTRVDDRDLEALADLSGLEHFSLSSPNVKGPGLAHLLAAKNLRELQFVGSAATDAWMSEVEPLRNVEWIELHGTNITGGGLAAIKGWSKLKSAYLNQNPIDDRAIPHLAELYRLNQLELNDTAMTQDGISRLREALPDTGIGFQAPENKAEPYGSSRAQ